MNPMNRREFLKRGLAATSVLAAGGNLPSLLRGSGRLATRTKVLVLGFDGLDPRLLDRWLKEGKLPAFARLISAGDFRPLRTSLPPPSPVAWSNFNTGTDPGEHGIFDVMHRDPQTYIPTFSASLSTQAKKTLKIGNLVLPLSGGEAKNLLARQTL